MILTDYFRSEKDTTWDFAVASGVRHGVIRLPENQGFDYGNRSDWDTLVKKFENFGITPVAIEPMPNELHDHIKAGDTLRDESIEKVISMFPHMQAHGISTICFNFMAHIGWLRTSSSVFERGGATVTEFNAKDFVPTGARITGDELWANYEYFIQATGPYAEKHGIKLALHPDDPPVERLGDGIELRLGEDLVAACREDVGVDVFHVVAVEHANALQRFDLQKMTDLVTKRVSLVRKSLLFFYVYSVNHRKM